MKHFNNCITISIILTLTSCLNNSEEIGISCAKSDLAIKVDSSIKSDCDQPGSITVSATGGEGSYLFSKDDQNFQESGLFEGVFAGQFNLTVKDTVGCTASISFSLESEPTGINLSVNSTPSDCLDATGSVTAEANGGLGALQFSIDGGTFSENATFTALERGPHSVTVLDEEGCRETKTVVISSDASLSDDIMPIISQNCAVSGCHNGSRSPNLSTEAQVISNSNRVRSRTANGSMPPSGRDDLTEDEIALIECWVEAGAKDN